MKNRTRGPEGPADRPTFLRLDEALRHPEFLQPPECLVPHLAWRGRLVILAGPDKAGKSTLAAHAVTALTKGAPFLGKATHEGGGKCVWVGLEEHFGDAIRRLETLEAAAERVFVLLKPPSDLPGAIAREIKEKAVDLVVIDSLMAYAREVHDGKVPADGDNAGWSEVVRPLSRLAHETNVGIVLIHHTRRADGQYRGASEIAAAADVLLELSVTTHKTPNRRAITGRGRICLEDVKVELTEQGYVAVSQDEAPGSALRETVREWIFLHPGSGKKAVRSGIGGRAELVDAELAALLGEGLVVNRGTSAAWRLHVADNDDAIRLVS
jgi:hypothetical protein